MVLEHRQNKYSVHRRKIKGQRGGQFYYVVSELIYEMVHFFFKFMQVLVTHIRTQTMLNKLESVTFYVSQTMSNLLSSITAIIPVLLEVWCPLLPFLYIFEFI